MPPGTPSSIVKGGGGRGAWVCPSAGVGWAGGPGCTRLLGWGGQGGLDAPISATSSLCGFRVLRDEVKKASSC